MISYIIATVSHTALEADSIAYVTDYTLLNHTALSMIHR